MYSKEVRERALELLGEGFTVREVSRMMGGKPSAACIHGWSKGRVPTGKRESSRYYPLASKIEAVKRVESGADYKEVARELNCKGSVVLGWRRIYLQSGEIGLRTRYDKYLLSEVGQKQVRQP